MSNATSFPTINSQELENFKNSCPTWWDSEGPAKLLHTLNDLRIPWIIEGVVESGQVRKQQAQSSKPLQGLTILDIGCGVGILTEPLSKLGGTVVGVDPCEATIREAKKHHTLNSSLINVVYLNETVEEHAEKFPEKYDVVVASEVVDHVDEPHLFLELCCKCLKPGGSIYITTYNQTWTSWLVAIIFYEYIWRLVRRGCHSWSKFITPESIEKTVNKFNCRTKDVRGLHLNVRDVTWQWVESTSVSYGLYAVKDKP